MSRDSSQISQHQVESKLSRGWAVGSAAPRVSDPFSQNHTKLSRGMRAKAVYAVRLGLGLGLGLRLGLEFWAWVRGCGLGLGWG